MTLPRATLILPALLCVLGCTTRTEFGPCVGIVDDRNPALIYKVSAWNVTMAVTFAETIVVPVVVLADEVSCPRGRK